MPSDEAWLPVPGYPGYEVSDHGRVRSLDRETRSRWGTPRKQKGRTLSQVRAGGSGGRYRACTLYRDGKPRQITVHVLVLETFVGPRPGGAHGCHRDDDPNNNRLENLYWGTAAQNAQDAVNNGRCWKTRITHCPQGHEYTPENTYTVAKSGHRQCRTCIKQRSDARSTMPYSSDRTHCPQGHPYDEANTYHPSPNRRACKTCSRDRSREYQRRKRQRQ